MDDYSESLVAARVCLRELEEAANAGRYQDMAAYAHTLGTHAEAIRFWAFSQPLPPEPTV